MPNHPWIKTPTRTLLRSDSQKTLTITGSARMPLARTIKAIMTIVITTMPKITLKVARMFKF